MNKTLIAIVVAAGLVPATAMADATVYGRIHTSVDSISGVAANTNSLYVNSNSSRFGVKGGTELDGGLRAMFQLESGVTSVGGNGTGDGNPGPTNGTLFSGMRDTYIGLAGNFGTFLAGRLPAENQYVYDSNLFADQIGDAATFTSGGAAGIGRANSALYYQTTDMSGFKGALTYLPASSVVNSGGGADSGNSYGLKLDYAKAGITANFAYFNVKAGAAAGDFKPMSLAGSYDFGNGMVTAQYVRNKNDVASTSTTQNIYNIGGKFNVFKAGAVKAQYSKAGDASGTTGTGASMFAIGYDHNLNKQADVYVAYAAVSNDSAATYRVDNYGHGANSTAPAAGEDPKGFSVGLTYNF